MPKRIRRERSRGWRMPKNSVYVGRPTKWGNPFRVVEVSWSKRSAAFLQAFKIALGPFLCRDREQAAKFFKECLHRAKNGFPFPAPPIQGEFTAKDIEQFKTLANNVHELRGKNLACWCLSSECCHADVLLELANA